MTILCNCEEQLTSTDCRPADNQQCTERVTNRLPTVGKNTREKKYSTETYVKTNKTYPKAKNKKRKTYQKRRTAYRKSRGLDKHGKTEF